MGIGAKSSTTGMPGNGDRKTLINKHLKIQNITQYRGESAMGT
jgi:hypothetical protein